MPTSSIGSTSFAQKSLSIQLGRPVRATSSNRSLSHRALSFGQAEHIRAMTSSFDVLPNIVSIRALSTSFRQKIAVNHIRSPATGRPSKIFFNHLSNSVGCRFLPGGRGCKSLSFSWAHVQPRWVSSIPSMRTPLNSGVQKALLHGFCLRPTSVPLLRQWGAGTVRLGQKKAPIYTGNSGRAISRFVSTFLIKKHTVVMLIGVE